MEALPPSDALAALATAIHQLQHSMDAGLLEKWLQATEVLENEDPVDYWLLDPVSLYSTPALRQAAWMLSPATDAAEFVILVRAVQALDAWHAPLFPRSDETLAMLDAHQEVLDRRAIDGMLGSDATGYLIPARLWERDIIDFPMPPPSAPYDAAPTPSVLRQLLDRTAYIPRLLPAENPDAPGVMDGRTIEILYQVHLGAPIATRSLFDPIKVGIAPLVEARSEAVFECDGRCYAINPTYPFERLESVVRDALLQEVELMLFPEMSVAEARISDLSELIRTSWLQVAADLNATPKLRYVIAGIAGGVGSGGQHRNFVIMFDHFGHEIMRQDKIHRWNLAPVHLDRYGLDSEFGLSGNIEENIAPASSVTLLDVPDLGRVIHMICADVSFNSPGDWLLQHCGTDWVHAPIMDQSTQIAPLGPTSQWILRRALRAASLGHGRVMVTNSMAITQRANDTNALSASKHAFIVDDVTLGLFLDAMTGRILYHRLATACSSPPNILKTADWNSAWDEFPN